MDGLFYFLPENLDIEVTDQDSALGHDYSSKSAKDAYLCSAATCTADAVYYHKCVRCDSKGTTSWTNFPKSSAGEMADFGA